MPPVVTGLNVFGVVRNAELPEDPVIRINDRKKTKESVPLQDWLDLSTGTEVPVAMSTTATPPVDATPTPNAPATGASGGAILASASPHQRLLAKQTIIDEWSTREKLFLVSVVSSNGGDQNWVSVARTMKGSMAATANSDDPDQARPADWYSQKNCALQYDRMLEKHQRDAPPLSRRTKRTSESGAAASAAGSVPAPSGGATGPVGPGASGAGTMGTPDPAQVIAKKLKDERTKELMTLVEHTNRVMANLMEEIDELEDDHISEERLDEIEREMAQEEAEERAQKRAREEAMKERERKKLELAAALKTGAAAKPLTGAASASVQAAKERRLSEASEVATATTSTSADNVAPIPADSSESTEAGPSESQNPRTKRSQKEVEVVEDRSEKAEDAPKSTPAKVEKDTEDEDKKRLPPPSTASVIPTQSVITTSSSGVSTASTVNTTSTSAASDTVTPSSNVRSSKRTTSEKSEDNEEETTGPSRGRRTSKRTSASNPEPGGDEETNPAMPENRRLSRIRGAATGSSHADDGSGGSRGRRGSGTTSRSSSPTGSEDTVRDESESEPNTPGLVRSTRSRRRSGIRPGLALEESAPSSPASAPAVESAAKTEPVAESGANSGGGVLSTASEGAVAASSTASAKPSLTASLTTTAAASSSAATPTTAATSGTGKPFKNQGLLILNNIQTHQFALTFETAMSAKSAPDYPNIILRPMDLKTIKSNLEAGTVSNMHEMFRDLSLMLLNATMFSPTGSQVRKPQLQHTTSFMLDILAVRVVFNGHADHF
eukprot:TCALIF_03899-PA protein Name:"Similar to BRD8 Bromodomain-containing protein 8 (Homo sapiens)" AED:0.39 eAED:0.40 QI:0/0/0/0.5/1/1/2/0/779